MPSKDICGDLRTCLQMKGIGSCEFMHNCYGLSSSWISVYISTFNFLPRPALKSDVVFNQATPLWVDKLSRGQQKLLTGGKDAELCADTAERLLSWHKRRIQTSEESFVSLVASASCIQRHESYRDTKRLGERVVQYHRERFGQPIHLCAKAGRFLLSYLQVLHDIIEFAYSMHRDQTTWNLITKQQGNTPSSLSPEP
jgi:hypothetical protein